MTHEMSLMADLLSKIEQVAIQHGGGRVVSVSVRLGALAHISEGHFREHFEHGTRGSLSEGAALHVVTDTDETAPHAQDILLESVEVAT